MLKLSLDNTPPYPVLCIQKDDCKTFIMDDCLVYKFIHYLKTGENIDD